MSRRRTRSRRCARAGFVGMALPAEHGGHGLDIVARHVASEELLAAGAPLAAHWIADRQSGPQVLRHGSEALRRAVLPQVAAGGCCFAIGMSEPDVGSDLAAVRTRAERVDGGWRLSGHKLWTTNAHNADFMTVLCRTAPAADRHGGLTQLVVDMRWPGIAVRTVENLAGDADFCEVVFDAVEVPDSHVLGAPGDGWRLVTEELALERSGPDRFLSTAGLLTQALERVPGQDSVAAIGRMVAWLGTLHGMSLSVAAATLAREPCQLEAVVVKDVGTAFEQDLPHALRALLGIRASPDSPDRLGRDMATAILYAPSFTLRGGTREILRGIIARGLGVR